MIDRQFARDLVARFGSPLYAYDLDEVERRARILISILPKGATLFYSFKANPLPAIAATARQAGCRAEVSSLGELQVAQQAGFAGEHILYSGPGKSEEQVHAALSSGVTHFSCESWTDVTRVQNAARKLKRKAKVLLRVNPSHAPHAKLAITGVESQFGFEEESLLGLGSQLRALDGAIEIIGVHVYWGTQISMDTISSTTKAAIETAGRISDRLGFACRVIDAGGGFPWPYASSEAGPDLANLKQEFADLRAQSRITSSAEIWFESGRYVCASSGTLLTTVVDVKASKNDKKYVVLNAGINHLGGMSGLGRIPRPFVSIELLAMESEGELETCDIVGPLCSTLDSLGRNLKVPRLKVGDVISIPNVGAYGLSASLIGFLSHPPPKEIAFRGRQVVETYRLRWGHERI